MSKKAEKDLKKVPKEIARVFKDWAASIIREGLEKVRKVPGFHDEPLKGKWKGYRSVRLNRAYRAFYRIESDSVTFVLVERVNKHDY